MKRTWSRTIWNVAFCCAAVGISCSKDPGAVGENKGNGGSEDLGYGGNGGGAGSIGGSGGGGRSTMTGIIIDTDASVASGSGGQGGAAPPTEEVNCGITSVDTQKLPADLLLVLDRSNSMTKDITQDAECASGSTTCTSRWKAITDAVNIVLPDMDDTVYWGLKFFGTSNNGCDVSDTIDVAPGANNAKAVADQIAKAKPSTGTPTALVIEKTGAYMSKLTDPNPKYILLATDGQPYCGGTNKDQPDDDAAIASIKSNAFDKGVKVFVVGLAIDDKTVETLNKMADAGGTGSYYPANSPDTLKEALQKISGIVASCNYKVQFTDAGVPDPANIAVFLDGERLPSDPDNGWVFDSGKGEVDITGSYCTSIKDGTKKNVQVLVGCAPIPQGTIP
jgi:hypothetical protein